MVFWKRKSAADSAPDIDLIVGDFVKGVPQNYAQCQINTSQLGDFVSRLHAALSENGMANIQIEQLMTTDITGVCPSCGVRLQGGVPVKAGFRQQRQYAQSASRGGGSQEMDRLVQGSCVTKKCKSKELTICLETR